MQGFRLIDKYLSLTVPWACFGTFVNAMKFVQHAAGEQYSYISFPHFQFVRFINLLAPGFHTIPVEIALFSVKFCPDFLQFNPNIKNYVVL
jgi:hypothetical protein